MHQDDIALISAYLDNELDVQQRRLVEQRLVDDNDFATLFQQLDFNDQQLKTHYAAIDNKPLPAGLQALLQPEAEHTHHSHNSSNKSVLRWLPMAASVAAVALLVPVYLSMQQPQITLASVLDNGLSGETTRLDDQSSITLVMSFKDQKAQWCREYLHQHDNAVTQTIACKGSGGWYNEISVTGAVADDSVFIPASGQNNAIEAWLDANMASDVLSLAEERRELK